MSGAQTPYSNTGQCIQEKPKDKEGDRINGISLFTSTLLKPMVPLAHSRAGVTMHECG